MHLLRARLFAVFVVLASLAIATALDTYTELYEMEIQKMRVERDHKLHKNRAKDALLKKMVAEGAFKNDPVIAHQSLDRVGLLQPRDLPLIMAGINPAIATGPCSSYLTAPVINVTTPDDFSKRLQFPPNQTVILQLIQNVTLVTGLILDGNYSCTIIKATDIQIRRNRGVDMKLADDTRPALRITDTNNIILLGVNVKLDVTNDSPFCDPYAPELFPLPNITVCPSIHVFRSYGIVIAKGKIFGRVDILRSMYVTVDSNQITGPSLFEVSPGAIRVGKSGVGTLLIKSHIVISNNEIYNVNTPVALLFGAVGVSVVNNFIHTFIWTATRCGMNTHFAGDCMLNHFGYNYVYDPPGYPYDFDSTGIYFYTHWINPGNTLTCNYVVGSFHCMYLDNMSSGMKITGGVCANTFDGIKVNGGKNNIIKGVLTYNLTQNTPAWVSCLFYETFNCVLDPGTFWEQMRAAHYNTPQINKLFPFLSTICTAKSINGVSCNPSGSNFLPGSATGYCSGLPFGNVLDMIMLDATLVRNPYGRYCERVPGALQINYPSFLNITSAQAGLNNLTANDFGLRRDSRLRVIRRGIQSCPKSLVGIQPVAVSSYYNMWNINRPADMDIVSTFIQPWVFGNV